MSDSERIAENIDILYPPVLMVDDITFDILKNDPIFITSGDEAQGIGDS